MLQRESASIPAESPLATATCNVYIFPPTSQNQPDVLVREGPPMAQPERIDPQPQDPVPDDQPLRIMRQDESTERVTLQHVADDYLAKVSQGKRKRSDATLRDYRRAIGLFGDWTQAAHGTRDYPLGDISDEDFDDFLDWVQDTVAGPRNRNGGRGMVPATADKYRRYLRAIFRSAAPRGDRNPRGRRHGQAIIPDVPIAEPLLSEPRDKAEISPDDVCAVYEALAFVERPHKPLRASKRAIWRLLLATLWLYAPRIRQTLALPGQTLDRDKRLFCYRPKKQERHASKRLPLKLPVPEWYLEIAERAKAPRLKGDLIGFGNPTNLAEWFYPQWFTAQETADLSIRFGPHDLRTPMRTAWNRAGQAANVGTDNLGDHVGGWERREATVGEKYYSQWLPAMQAALDLLDVPECFLR